jgi:OmpA-OmpF porin, OOP family
MQSNQIINMGKKGTFVLLLIIIMLAFVTPGFSQVKVDVEKKVETQVNNRANTRTDQAIDKGLDKLEEGIGKLFGKRKKKKKNENNEQSNQQQQQTEQENSQQQQQQKTEPEKPEIHTPSVVWSKFDFVPGDEVIFEDAPSVDEENGEFPSRWDLEEGSTEIGEMDGELVIMFLDGGGSIVPYLKNSNEDYLPEVFTLEFDAYFEPGSHFHRYWVTFQDNKNQWQKGLNERMTLYVNGIEFLTTDKRYPGTEKYNWGNNPVGGWKHISVAYTKGKFKAYMDDTRLINIPHLQGNPWGITIEAENDNMFIKNIRIAKGGVKYYDRMMSDGKIIVNGIKFDVNKTTLRPESIGPINEIFDVLQKSPETKFSVEGHTDSDGDNDLNQTLSVGRAEAVMNKLIEMGISADRLTFKGFGESKPITDNSSAEGKANNRRVEFVKI